MSICESALESSKRLAIAMMAQAVRDLKNCETGHLRDAVRWIQTGDTGVFSFALCCQVLDWQQERTRRLLLDIRQPSPFLRAGRVDQRELDVRPHRRWGVDGPVSESH